MSNIVQNFQTRQIDQQLTTDTAIYASGDVLVDTVAVPLGVNPQAGKIRLKIEQVTVIDKDALSGAFDIVFLSANNSLGTINAAVSISDANSLAVVKTVSVTSSNYTTLTSGGNVVANIDLAAPIFIECPADSANFYVGLISRDTKTYTASALYVRFAVQFISESL